MIGSMSDIDRAVDLLATCERILVFTGAGISTESGIPDFRGPDGVWNRVDPEEFTIQRYLINPDTRKRSWAMRLEGGILGAEPNDGHRAITELWETGRLIGCVTQNIDGLHATAGLPPEAIVELHGNLRTTRCLDCGDTQPTAAVLQRVASGDDDPPCDECGGILKVDVTFFGEPLPSGEVTRAMAMAMVADAAISVGSTLSVYPASYVPLTVAESGRPLVIINQGTTDLDRVAAVTIDGPAGATMRALADALA
jgi:NAD-dependent deacetylase